MNAQTPKENPVGGFSHLSLYIFNKTTLPSCVFPQGCVVACEIGLKDGNVEKNDDHWKIFGYVPSCRIGN